ncbi:MAG: hypothetical protein AAB152_09195 [Candidatus Coatesbacteria bacterium]
MHERRDWKEMAEPLYSAAASAMARSKCLRISTLAAMCLTVSGICRATPGDWALAVNAGALGIRPGGVLDSLHDMADAEFSRFRTAYGATSASMVHTSALTFGIPSVGFSMRHRTGERWGWSGTLEVLGFESHSRITMKGTAGESLEQRWNLDVTGVPVLVGLWTEIDTPHGWILRAESSAGLTLIHANLAVDRQFTGPGGAVHYWEHDPLVGVASTLDLCGSIGRRLFSWCSIGIEVGYLLAAPASLGFTNESDVNLDGFDEYMRGEVLADRFRSPVDISLSGWHARLGLNFTL